MNLQKQTIEIKFSENYLCVGILILLITPIRDSKSHLCTLETKESLDKFKIRK